MVHAESLSQPDMTAGAAAKRNTRSSSRGESGEMLAGMHGIVYYYVVF